MANPPPPTTPRSHLLRPSTIAASAKRTVPQPPKRAKPKRTAKQAKKKTARPSTTLISEYVESSASKEDEEEEEDEPSGSEFTLDGRVFRRATSFASKKNRKKTSHVWEKDKGFEIIDVKTKSRHYYCIQCCDKEKDENYTPLAISGTSNLILHWKSRHGIDKDGKPVKKETQKKLISFVLRTSLNCSAIISIVAHYIDSKDDRQAKLIALRSLYGENTGENMAALLLKVFREYKIGGRIGFFVLDNASSNDVCVDLVLQKLYPEMNAKQRRRRRLRCLGHVINLAAQAFLFGKTSQETLEELDVAYRRHDFEAIAKVWRKQGILGRLHNIVRYIRMTPQRRAEWRKTVIGTKKWSRFDGLEVSSSCLRKATDTGQ